MDQRASIRRHALHCCPGRQIALTVCRKQASKKTSCVRNWNSRRPRRHSQRTLRLKSFSLPAKPKAFNRRERRGFTEHAEKIERKWALLLQSLSLSRIALFSSRLGKKLCVFEALALFVFFRKQRFFGIFPLDFQVRVVPKHGPFEFRKIKFGGFI